MIKEFEKSFSCLVFRNFLARDKWHKEQVDLKDLLDNVQEILALLRVNHLAQVQKDLYSYITDSHVLIFTNVVQVWQHCRF